MLDIVNNRYQKQLEGGFKNLELNAMKIAFLEADIDKAIEYLQAAMARGYILDFQYIFIPVYAKLRQHPEWPAILSESDNRAVIQREIYLKLVAEEDKTTL